MNRFEDEKGLRLYDVVDIHNIQINVTFPKKDKKNAFKIHSTQNEKWVCLKGSLKVGLVDNLNPEKQVKWVILKQGESVNIPVYMWHGYCALEDDTIMMYYIDRKYDPADEQKVEPGHFGETW